MKVVSSVLTAAMVSQVTALTKEERIQLVRRAIPFNGRKLNNNNNGGSYITAYDSIQFNSCVSMTIMPEDEDQQTIGASDQLKSLFESGDIVSQKSVVLFNICQTSSCSYDAEDNLYVTDLGTYLQLVGYRPQKTFDYCDTCQEAQDWCQYGQYAEAEAEGDAADGGRKLDVQYVDCGTCESLGCYVQNQEQDNGNGQQQMTLEGMVEWVQQMAECVDTGFQWNGMELYSSFMCNEAGDGVEMAIFLDDNCGLYTSQSSYSSLYPNDVYIKNSQSVVTYPFTTDIDCAPETEWMSPEEAQNADGENQNNNNGDGNAEVNGYCQQLFEQAVLPIANCGNYNNQNQNAENQDDGNGYSQYFAQFTYNLMGKDDAENPYAVCAAVKDMQGEYTSFKKTKSTYNVYKADSSGQNYNYKTNKASQSSGKMSGGAIAGTVIGVLVACAIIGFVAVKYYQKKKDAKREPLVSEGIAA